MKTTKTLMLTALTALSLGAGAAMAQESAGGVNAGPYETMELNNLLAQQQAAAAQAANTEAATRAPQYGSSERPVYPVPTLESADGNGG